MFTFFVVISVVRYGPPTRTEYRIHVENISSRVSWQVCFGGRHTRELPPHYVQHKELQSS